MVMQTSRQNKNAGKGDTAHGQVQMDVGDGYQHAAHMQQSTVKTLK